ncbi:MAG: IS30 family transposase, partial [Prevotella sp.]|nr:IS30 family transposase [Prevotella sp.]
MYKHLTRKQRYAIYLGKQRNQTNKAIAQLIGVSESTVCRELRRNVTKSGKYVWDKADAMSSSRVRRCPGNRAVPAMLRWRIEEYIRNEQWSPKQISGYLEREEGIKVSHETIYKFIRQDASGKLAANCRHKMRYHRKGLRKHETKATNIRNRVSIHERPAEADGKRFGDWEMDLIVD